MNSLPASQREIERKYEAPHGGETPERFRAGLVASEPETFELTATYYDTAQLTLSRHLIAVRHRSGGTDAGWHIKQRREGTVLETAWPSSDTPPEQLLEQLRKLTGENIDELNPIATVNNARTRRMLSTATTEAVIEFVDDRVSSHHHPTGERRAWREWEAELVDTADEGLLDAIEPDILATGAYLSLSPSKVGRAMGALRSRAQDPALGAPEVAAVAVTDMADLLAGNDADDPRIGELRALASRLRNA